MDKMYLRADLVKGTAPTKLTNRLAGQGEVKIFGNIPVNASGKQKVSYELASRIKGALSDFKVQHPKDYSVMNQVAQGAWARTQKWYDIRAKEGKAAGKKYLASTKSPVWPAGAIWHTGAGGRHTSVHMGDFLYPWKWAAEPEKHGLSKEGTQYLLAAFNKRGVRYSRKDPAHLGNHLELDKKLRTKLQDPTSRGGGTGKFKFSKLVIPKQMFTPPAEQDVAEVSEPETPAATPLSAISGGRARTDVRTHAQPGRPRGPQIAAAPSRSAPAEISERKKPYKIPRAKSPVSRAKTRRVAKVSAPPPRKISRSKKYKSEKFIRVKA